MKDTGGNAFPTTEFVDGIGERFDVGMTLRDYFAAKALPIARTLVSDECFTDVQINTIANYSYLLADAMLEARK